MSNIQDRLQALFPVHYRSGNVLLLNADCMEVMKHIRNDEFELSCVDPPYGIDAASDVRGNTQYGNAAAPSKSYGQKAWDKKPPTHEWFLELRRVSKNQIVWGANHFMHNIRDGSPCWIVWDKLTGNNGYADCELAYTSFQSAVRKFTYQWMGMLQGDMKNKEERIHPTQKPVKLYEWLLTNYAEPGQRILDTHLGSGSSAIAAHYYGVDFVGCEIDPDYYQAAKERFDNETRQIAML